MYSWWRGHENSLLIECKQRSQSQANRTARVICPFQSLYTLMEICGQWCGWHVEVVGGQLQCVPIEWHALTVPEWAPKTIGIFPRSFAYTAAATVYSNYGDPSVINHKSAFKQINKREGKQSVIIDKLLRVLCMCSTRRDNYQVWQSTPCSVKAHISDTEIDRVVMINACNDHFC